MGKTANGPSTFENGVGKVKNLLEGLLKAEEAQQVKWEWWKKGAQGSLVSDNISNLNENSWHELPTLLEASGLDVWRECHGESTSLRWLEEVAAVYVLWCGCQECREAAYIGRTDNAYRRMREHAVYDFARAIAYDLLKKNGKVKLCDCLDRYRGGLLEDIAKNVKVLVVSCRGLSDEDRREIEERLGELLSPMWPVGQSWKWQTQMWVMGKVFLLDSQRKPWRCCCCLAVGRSWIGDPAG